MNNITIAIDAMGGDQGVLVTVPASLRMLHKNKALRLVLVGKEDVIREKIASYGKYSSSVSSRFTIHNATEQVLMSDMPSKALRSKKDSSMRVAINLVKEKKALACVSAGNTGALMAIAKFVLKTLQGVTRPAIITSFPSRDENRVVRMIDLGANIDSSPEILHQFAVMGSVLASAVDNIDQPKVGLLNVGEEDIKGNDVVKDTAQMLLEDSNINYKGYIEGDDIFNNIVDIVVCDGFVGNISLKSMEGMVNLVSFYIKKELRRSLYARFVSLLMVPVLKKFKKRLDPGRYNGASLIGLNGIVIKSHGSASRDSFAFAINEAIVQIEKNVPELIKDHVISILEKVSKKESTK